MPVIKSTLNYENKRRGQYGLKFINWGSQYFISCLVSKRKHATMTRKFMFFIKTKLIYNIIIILDNASIKFDEKLVVWYRTELGKIIEKNPYKLPFNLAIEAFFNKLIIFLCSR